MKTALEEGLESLNKLEKDEDVKSRFKLKFEALLKAISAKTVNWDFSNVTNVSNMFTGATTFNQDISDWKIGEQND